MIRMNIKNKVISMARSDSWTSTNFKRGGSQIERFCTDNCPHANEECKGECIEFTAFMRSQRSRRKCSR